MDRHKEIYLMDIPTPTGVRDRQGYKVYSANGITLSLTSCGGGLGRYAGLYLIVKKGLKDE